jgi:DNA modification methylase
MFNAIAALNTKRNYFCIERDEKYFEIMKNRIDDWHSQSGLIQNDQVRSPHLQTNKVISIEKHKQLSLFG